MRQPTSSSSSSARRPAENPSRAHTAPPTADAPRQTSFLLWYEVLSASHDQSCSAQLVNNLSRRIRSARSRQTISRMRAIPAQKQSANRRLISCPLQNRPHRKNLIQRQRSEEHVPARKSVFLFQIFWRNHLHAFHQRRQIRRVLSQRLITVCPNSLRCVSQFPFFNLY